MALNAYIIESIIIFQYINFNKRKSNRIISIETFSRNSFTKNSNSIVLKTHRRHFFINFRCVQLICFSLIVTFYFFRQLAFSFGSGYVFKYLPCILSFFTILTLHRIKRSFFDLRHLMLRLKGIFETFNFSYNL